jgi:hypothetical protein
MNIVSVSRRTDIPAFYSEWFMNRVRIGHLTVFHPYTKKEIAVSLAPEDVVAFVFWSKNYAPFLPYFDELIRRGYHFYCHFTITGLPKSIETTVIPTNIAIAQFKEIARILSPEHVQWRFDPIVITETTDLSFHKETFERIASALAGSTYRCYTSFMNPYDKALKNLKQASISVSNLPDEQKTLLAASLAEESEKYGITLYACSNDILVGGKVQKASCIDAQILQKITPHPIPTQIVPTRPQCACIKSIDIGAYDTCPHGCLYCYANTNKSVALNRYKEHHSDSESLLISGGSFSSSIIRSAHKLSQGSRLKAMQLQLF